MIIANPFFYSSINIFLRCRPSLSRCKRAFCICILLACVSSFSYGQEINVNTKGQLQSAQNAYSTVGQPLTKIFPASEHGGHNQNWTSFQSKNGFIFVGHTEGLSAWDGKQWLNIYTPHRTPVRSFSEFRDALYYGTIDGIFELSLNSAGLLVTRAILPSDIGKNESFGQIWSTAVNQHGVIFSAPNHSFFYDGKSSFLIKNAISSAHTFFAIDEAFYFKPRHLSHLYKIETSIENDELVFSQQKLDIALPEEARVIEIIKNKAGELVIFTMSHGVFTYSANRLKQIYASGDFAKGAQLYDAIQSSDDFYYISTMYHGLFILDANLTIVRRYTEQSGISMNTVFSVNEDLQNNIWLTGIPNVVKFRPPHVVSKFDIGETSTEILQLKNTSLGFFAMGNGKYRLNENTEYLQPPNFDAIDDDENNVIDFVEYDGKLISSGYYGVFELTLDKTNTKLVEKRQLIDTIQARNIQYILNLDSFAVATDDGIFLLSKNISDYRVKQFDERIGGAISMLYHQRADDLWMGTSTGGLFQLKNITSNKTQAPLTDHGRSNSLSGWVKIFDINDNVVISSEGQLFTHRNQTIPPITLPMLPDDWLSDSSVLDPLLHTPAYNGIPERVWYSKNDRNGYFEKTPKGEWVEKTAMLDTIPEGPYDRLYLTDNDILWFVRNKVDIYRVDLKRAEDPPEMAPLNILMVTSANEALSFMPKNENSLELRPLQKNVRFSFASAGKVPGDNNIYRTRIAKQSDDEATWSPWSTENYRDFTEIPYGNYLFEVEAKDAWGRVSNRNIDLRAVAPWYLNNVAYFIYVALALIMFFGFAWLVQKWQTQRLELANKKLERTVGLRTKQVNEKVEQLRQQQELKDRFFSNVSHEFRTPLTLTIGPLETVMSQHKSELSQPISHLIQMALSNANKMLALVGQVLDMNRLEAGKLPLRVAQYEVAELLRNIASRFEPWASQHEQNIQTIGCEEPLLLWFDIDQFDKCISNLLSNAIKYSGKHTTIKLVLTNHTSFTEILVQDNGIGISDSSKDKVFERFYQDKTSVNITTPGTGIGLALVKEIMEIHGGSATLDKEYTHGCRFVLKLLNGKSHYDIEQIVEPTVAGQDITESNRPESLLPRPSDNERLIVDAKSSALDSEDITTLLIVDDNVELLNFMSLRLSASFKIIKAENGQDGLHKAMKCLPDLIISDVNMPIMTGLELTQKLKAQSTTKTIPVILLTAKATKREVVEGFSVGADDYLTKPFDTSELIVRVNAQINTRKLIRQSIKAANAKILHPVTNSSPFRDKASNIISSNICEPDFNVDKLASALFVSRDTLIRKCKKEFGQTPLNIIVGMRMDLADQMLKDNSKSVSEVAYACGFESLAYFSKSYKKQRGKSPSEVRVGS